MPIDIFESSQSYNKLFHSYCIRPDITFDTQHNDEELLLLVRAHPITFIPWIFNAILFFFIPFVLNVALLRFLSLREILFIDFFWYSVLVSYIFQKVLGWLFNVGIVTNQRVLDVDYTMVLSKKSSATSIEDITDASENTIGYLRSLFRYGDVFVQTAGTEQNIEFLAVPEPAEVVSIINRLMR